MSWWNDQECRYSRDPAEIEKAVTNAYRYARDREIGSAAAPAASEVFADRFLEEEDEPDTPSTRAQKALREAGIGLRVRSLEEAETEPAPGWLVPGAILNEGLAVLYSPPKRGKTFAALDLALSCASGRSWFDQWPIEVSGPVLYLALEGYYEVVERAKAWQAHHGRIAEGRLHLMDGFIDLSDLAQVDVLIGVAQRLAPDPALVVVETVARAMSAAGLDENLARDQGLLAHRLERLGDRLRCPVVAAHHTGKDVSLGMRGSNALLAAAASAISVNLQHGTLSLQVAEIRRGPPGATLHAVPATTGEHPVWRGKDPLPTDGPRPENRERLRARALLRAVVVAATSAVDAETTTRGEFMRRVAAHLPPEDARNVQEVRRRVERLLDSHSLLRGRLLAANGRIALSGRGDRAALYRDVNLEPEGETP